MHLADINSDKEQEGAANDAGYMRPLIKNVITVQRQSSITICNKSMCADIVSWQKENLEGTLEVADGRQENSRHLHIADVGFFNTKNKQKAIQCTLVIRIYYSIPCAQKLFCDKYTNKNVVGFLLQ